MGVLHEMGEAGEEVGEGIEEVRAKESGREVKRKK
jgi:hypothetical protein